MEATFQEVQQRLGFETQRHWSERAIRRSTPALLELFSLVTLFAHRHMANDANVVRRPAWYDETHPTFSDSLAVVRKELCTQEGATFSGRHGGRHGKSTAGVRGKANRCRLLCGLKAKAQLRAGANRGSPPA
jgi:hypothetical protein